MDDEGATLFGCSDHDSPLPPAAALQKPVTGLAAQRMKEGQTRNLVPVYQDRLATIYQGDFRTYLGVLPRDGVVITDPPWNIGYGYFDSYEDAMPDEDYVEMIRHLGSFRGVVVVHCADGMRDLVVPALGEPDCTMRWYYHPRDRKRFRLISMYGVGPADRGIREAEVGGFAEAGARASSADRDSSCDLVDRTCLDPREGRIHPCPIPLGLARRLVDMATKEGDTVVDPFSGSLVTIRAACESGRHAVGVELSESYVRAGVARLSKAATAWSGGK